MDTVNRQVRELARISSSMTDFKPAAYRSNSAAIVCNLLWACLSCAALLEMWLRASIVLPSVTSPYCSGPE
jgi:hypothetical protein